MAKYDIYFSKTFRLLPSLLVFIQFDNAAAAFVGLS